MHIGLTQVPYVLGDDHQGASKGPVRLIEGGRRQVGSRQTCPRTSGAGGSWRAVSRQRTGVFGCVQTVRSRCPKNGPFGKFSLILSGGCDVSKGILSGFDHSRCGVIWFDAYGVFNTPETTISGYLDGMSLAIITGSCYQRYWAQIGNGNPSTESGTLLVGVRDLDRAEEEHLKRSSVQLVKWSEGRPETEVRVALDSLTRSVREIYLHIDMDSLDPRFAPGVMFDPVPGGLSLEDMEQAIRYIFARFHVRAAALTVYTPDRD